MKKIQLSANMPVPDFAKALTGDIRGLKVGIPKEYRIDGTPAEINEVWERGAQWLRDAGAEALKFHCPTPSTPCRLIILLHRLKPHPTSHAMTVSVTACVKKGKP